MSTSSASTKILLTNQNSAHLASPLSSGASLPAMSPTSSAKNFPLTCSTSTMTLDPQWNQPHHQHNAATDENSQFNSIFHKAFFNIIAKSFPQMLPLITLFYEQAGTVHHKQADDTWCTLLIKEGIIQGCPLSSIFSSLVVANLLQPMTSNYVKELQLASSMVTRATIALGASQISLDMSTMSLPVSQLRNYNSSAADVPPLEQPLGNFVHPMTTHILTSTSNHSSISDLVHLNPTPATSTTNTISQYFTKLNDIDVLGPPTPAKLTTGFRLLGSVTANIGETIVLVLWERPSCTIGIRWIFPHNINIAYFSPFRLNFCFRLDQYFWGGFCSKKCCQYYMASASCVKLELYVTTVM